MLKLDRRSKQYTDIFNQYYALIYSIVYGKINNQTEADDICQEIFMRFFEKYDQVENHRKWLFGTLRLVMYEYYRSKDKRSVDIDEVFEDVSLTFVNGFRDTRIIIEEALNDAEIINSEEEKIIFDLIAVNNFSYNQVAIQLGLTKRKVQYKYHKISKRLVDHLKKKGISSFEELL
jgi:RNA polymerase sigma-70 factor (ECF subfamily)